MISTKLFDTYTRNPYAEENAFRQPRPHELRAAALLSDSKYLESALKRCGPSRIIESNEESVCRRANMISGDKSTSLVSPGTGVNGGSVAGNNNSRPGGAGGSFYGTHLTHL